MRVVYILIVGVCIASAKYLPETLSESKEIESQQNVFSSEEHEITEIKEEQTPVHKLRELHDDSEEEKIISQEQTEKQRLKEEAQERKIQEKREKEEQKLREKTEKENYKKEEVERKRKEKLEKKERKRLEKERKKCEKNSVETINAPAESDKKLGTEEETEPIDVNNSWENYIYTKYGISTASSDAEKEATFKKYMEEEFGLSINSTQSERRQAVIKLLQSESQNSSPPESTFKKYILNHLNATDVQDLQTILDWNINKLNDELKILENINTTWASISQKYAIEKKTLFQSLSTLLSNWLPDWITGANKPSGQTTNIFTVNINFDNPTGDDVAEKPANSDSNEVVTGSVFDSVKPGVVPTDSSSNISLSSSSPDTAVLIAEPITDPTGVATTDSASSAEVVTAPPSSYISTNALPFSINPTISVLEVTETTLLSLDEVTTEPGNILETTVSSTDTTMIAVDTTGNLVPNSEIITVVAPSTPYVSAVSSTSAPETNVDMLVATTDNLGLSAAATLSIPTTAGTDAGSAMSTDVTTTEGITTSELIQSYNFDAVTVMSVSGSDSNVTLDDTPSDLVPVNSSTLTIYSSSVSNDVTNSSITTFSTNGSLSTAGSESDKITHIAASTATSDTVAASERPNNVELYSEDSINSATMPIIVSTTIASTEVYINTDTSVPLSDALIAGSDVSSTIDTSTNTETNEKDVVSSSESVLVDSSTLVEIVSTTLSTEVPTKNIATDTILEDFDKDHLSTSPETPTSKSSQVATDISDAIDTHTVTTEASGISSRDGSLGLSIS